MLDRSSIIVSPAAEVGTWVLPEFSPDRVFGWWNRALPPAYHTAGTSLRLQGQLYPYHDRYVPTVFIFCTSIPLPHCSIVGIEFVSCGQPQSND